MQKVQRYQKWHFIHQDRPEKCSRFIEMQRNIEIFREIQRNAEKCREMQRNVDKCRKIQRNAEKCSEMLINAEIQRNAYYIREHITGKNFSFRHCPNRRRGVGPGGEG